MVHLSDAELPASLVPMKEVGRSKNYLKINKNLIQCLGLEAAVYLGILADKDEYFKKRKDYDGWFFQRQEDLALQVGLSEYRLRKCKQKCKKLGLLKTEMRGLPAKEWYHLKWDVITSFYQCIPIHSFSKGFRNLTHIPESNEPNKGLENEPLSIIRKLNKETKYKDTKERLVMFAGKKYLVMERKRSIPSDKKESHAIPYQEIKDAWNRITKDTPLTPISRITDSRRTHIKARFKEIPTITDWKKLFRKVVQSSFLCGDNSRGWRCEFDWLIANETNSIKVIEGKYTDRPAKKNGQQYSRLKESVGNLVKTTGKIFNNDAPLLTQ